MEIPFQVTPTALNKTKTDGNTWKMGVEQNGIKDGWQTNKTIQLNSNWGLGDQVGLQDLNIVFLVLPSSTK